MTEAARRLATGAALLALLLAGAALRLHRVREAPPGPWIDEALALRAARVASATGAPLLGTSPLQPPDAGFVNSWLTNLSLRGLSLVDRAAGGGISSVRAMSVLPALVLLAGIALMAEALNDSAADTLLIAGGDGTRSAIFDQDLVDRFKADGIRIARRTVAKYRLLLRIPPSHLRK